MEIRFATAWTISLPISFQGLVQQYSKFSFSDRYRVGIQCKLLTSAWPQPRQSGSLEREGGACWPTSGTLGSCVLRNLGHAGSSLHRVQNSPTELRKNIRAAETIEIPPQARLVGLGQGSHKDPTRGWRWRERLA